MDSSPGRLGERGSAIHELFGGGIVADVILWRRKEVTIGILLGTIFWVVIELTGYTLLSLVSNVLLLLLLILFVWAKAAGIINRPPPPIPKLQLSEETMNEVSSLVRSHFNAFSSAAYDVALGKDLKLFYKVAICLLVMAVVGGRTDFLSLVYTGLVLVLTVPALYERHEHHIIEYAIAAYGEAQKGYVRLDATFSKLGKRIALKIQKIKTC